MTDLEPPVQVNLGRYQCSYCKRLVHEHGKFDHNRAKHPELYRKEQIHNDIADQTGWKP